MSLEERINRIAKHTKSTPSEVRDAIQAEMASDRTMKIVLSRVVSKLLARA